MNTILLFLATEGKVMIRPIDGLPKNVVGFEAVGQVDAGDYRDVLEPAVDAALQEGEKIHLLYVLGAEFEGYTGGAMWEDTKIGLGHLSRWEKIAVVSDKSSLVDGVRALGWMVPGEIKVFPVDQLDEAKSWVAV